MLFIAGTYVRYVDATLFYLFYDVKNVKINAVLLIVSLVIVKLKNFNYIWGFQKTR